VNNPKIEVEPNVLKGFVKSCCQEFSRVLEDFKTFSMFEMSIDLNVSDSLLPQKGEIVLVKQNVYRIGRIEQHWRENRGKYKIRVYTGRGKWNMIEVDKNSDSIIWLLRPAYRFLDWMEYWTWLITDRFSS
jgi:hypothetical protein